MDATRLERVGSTAALCGGMLLTACGSADSSGLFDATGGAGGAGGGQGGITYVFGAGGGGGGAAAPPGATPTTTSTSTPPPSGGAGGQASFDAGGAPDANLPTHLQGLAACEFTGTWGTFIRVPVTWPAAPLVLLAGTGTIYQWNLSKRTQTGQLETMEDSVPCSIFLPDLQADVLQTYQKYGIRFPDDMFDIGDIRAVTFGTRATVAGSDLKIQTDVIATLVGLSMSSPNTGSWPPTTYAPEDHDQDSHVGVTVLPVEDTGYNFPPVGLPAVPFQDLPRARRIYLMTRSVAALSGTVQSCDQIDGAVAIQTVGGTPGINSTVIGCEKLDGTECVQSEWQFLDDNRPQFVPSGPGEFTSVRMPDDATCADVRAHFPIP